MKSVGAENLYPRSNLIPQTLKTLISVFILCILVRFLTKVFDWSERHPFSVYILHSQEQLVSLLIKISHLFLFSPTLFLFSTQHIFDCAVTPPYHSNHKSYQMIRAYNSKRQFYNPGYSQFTACI